MLVLYLQLEHVPYFSCFKREFTEAVALRMWEACWANYQTDYFHLFLCLAIIAVYQDDVIAQDLNTDEMLLHFSSLGKIKISYVFAFSYGVWCQLLVVSQILLQSKHNT